MIDPRYPIRPSRGLLSPSLLIFRDLVRPATSRR